MPVFPVLRRWKKEDLNLEGSLDGIAKSCLNKTNKQTKSRSSQHKDLHPIA
jgi:hypothetical protein